MAKVEHYHTQFEADRFYHIYNRSVDRKPLFKEEGNYEYFLKKYDAYLSPVTDTYAYCLLGNHFHLLLRVKSLSDLTTFEKLSNLEMRNPTTEKSVHAIISHQFRKFFQCYAMSFNKQQQRTGTLFQTPFKRALVNDEFYFTRLIYYIHANPQHHGLIADFREWPWSSYHRMLLNKPSKLKKAEVLDWFGNPKAYIQFHELVRKEQLIDAAFLEDDY